MFRGVPSSAQRWLQTAPKKQVETREKGLSAEELRAPGPSVRCGGPKTRKHITKTTL